MAARWVATKEVRLSDLRRFPGNARRGNVEEIRKSLRRHGQYRAIVVRACPDGSLVVLAGNHTADALEAEGHQTARCELIDCTDDEARRINLSDNRLSDIAEDDLGELAILLAYLDGDYEGTGWAEDEAAAVLAGDEDAGPGEGAPPDSADLPPGEDKYREQYGVIVICATEAEQQDVYEHLQGQGYDVKVVTT